MAKPPPPLRDLYFRITAFPTLLGAFRKASKGKRYRPEVLAFGANLEAELFQLQRELLSFVYSPGPYRQFTIREPKPRLVSAAPFRDRVVHHALIAVIAPPLERHFVRTSYANRHGYGSHRALRRFARACREHPWVLQADIRLYFPSIDHQLLLAQLERRIACLPTLWLLRAILANGASAGPAIDAFPGDNLLTPLQRPRGLPIGNLTSQFLANLHLDPIDHRLRSLPGVRAYLRYVDDLSLFADHPEPLRHSLTVLRNELHALRLRLHPSKTQLRRTATNDNTNIGLRPCCPSPPAPFTVRTAARDCSGRTRRVTDPRVQTRSGDRRPRRLIRTSPAHCPRPHDLAGRWAFPACWHASHVVNPIEYDR